MHEDGYRVTETFKVTFQQLCSAIYQHMPETVTHSAPGRTSSLPSTSVQAWKWTNMLLSLTDCPSSKSSPWRAFYHMWVLYCCSNKSPQLSYSRRSQVHLLGWHQGAGKAGLFLHCVGCCQNLVPAVLGPKAYVSLLWSAVSALCDFPLSPCGPCYQAYYLFVSFICLLLHPGTEDYTIYSLRPLFSCSAYCVPIACDTLHN